MRDYKLLAEGLRYCSKHICNKECGYYEICHRERGKEYPSVTSVGFDAADAIEELIAASPPALWTDEPIEGTEFMTHSQGGRKGFEIHFRTDSLEKYKAVQEECRRQIGHAKPEPPKGVE